MNLNILMFLVILFAPVAFILVRHLHIGHMPHSEDGAGDDRRQATALSDVSNHTLLAEARKRGLID